MISLLVYFLLLTANGNFCCEQYFEKTMQCLGGNRNKSFWEMTGNRAFLQLPKGIDKNSILQLKCYLECIISWFLRGPGGRAVVSTWIERSMVEISEPALFFNSAQINQLSRQKRCLKSEYFMEKKCSLVLSIFWSKIKSVKRGGQSFEQILDWANNNNNNAFILLSKNFYKWERSNK